LLRQELSRRPVCAKNDQFHGVAAPFEPVLPLIHFSLSGFPIARISVTRPSSSY
jgi:hypothetical protein